MLVRYILSRPTSEIYQGVSQKGVRKLAYQLALANNLPMHKTWLERFLKRHPSLSIRKPQAIYDIPGILSLALPRAASNIMAGFKVAGISPYDRDIPGGCSFHHRLSNGFLSLQQINLILIQKCPLV